MDFILCSSLLIMMPSVIVLNFAKFTLSSEISTWLLNIFLLVNFFFCFNTDAFQCVCSESSPVKLPVCEFYLLIS